ncbi:uncharacterized protein LOC135122019 [Zophobas morio]|uniref:uncharacterized protein LOC135122019 n=1 Tax=Zophobas morio TaxID=2755281 RepID=UPI0030829EA4
MENKKRKRSPKTTAEQFSLYIEKLENNINFRENAFHPGEDTDYIKSVWQNLTELLNSSGGPKKNYKEWKKTFSNWKTSVRAKARAIKASQKETGNDGEPEAPLTKLEIRLLNATGNIVVNGLDIPELGLEEEPVISKATNTASCSSTAISVISKPAGSGPRSSNAIPVISEATEAPSNSSDAIQNIRKKKCYNTFNSALKNLTMNTSQNEVEKEKLVVLRQINTNLSKLVELETFKLKLKYPQINIEETEDNVQ